MLWLSTGRGIPGPRGPAVGDAHGMDTIAWDDVVDILLDRALQDLRDGLPVTPTLVAHRGDEPRCAVGLRPFPPGGHDDALIEAASLVLALQPNRLALSLAGRAWSLRDPIPPVVEGVGDLRQRVVVVHVVDGARVLPDTYQVLAEVHGEGGDTTLTDRRRMTGGEGFVAAALLTMVTHARELTPRTDCQLGGQLARCVLLGHDVRAAPAARTHLVRAAAAYAERARDEGVALPEGLLASLLGEPPGAA